MVTLPARVDVALVKALARAFRWRRMLEDGTYGTIKELAAAEKINASYVSRVLRLPCWRRTWWGRSWTGGSRRA